MKFVFIVVFGINVYISVVYNYFWEGLDDLVIICWNIGLDCIVVNRWSEDSCFYVKVMVIVNIFKMFFFVLIYLMLKFIFDEIKWYIKLGIWIGCSINLDVK